VLFDLDNTLIDFLKMKNLSCEEAISAMIGAGLKMEKKKALKILFRLYDKHGIEYHEIFQEFLKKALGRIDWKILSEGIVAYRRIKNSFLEPYPRVIPTLIKLKKQGLKLGIVSDAPRLKAWLRIASMGLTEFFDFVITRDDVRGEKKPSMLPFRAAIRRLGLRPDEIVFVGDNPERDILGAKKAGMVTVLAKYGEWKRSPGIRADYEIMDVSELLGIALSSGRG
jgi:putative hydrolase of the HAD superfamily